MVSYWWTLKQIFTKIWNLNKLIFTKKNVLGNKEIESELTSQINDFIMKIDNSIKNFRFNVSIAYFYQVYKILKDYVDLEISNKILEENIIK